MPLRGGSDQKYALSIGLPVEQLVRLASLVQRPAVGEQPVHVDLPVHTEIGALRLDDVGEGPGRDQGQLPAQQMWADVDVYVVALAHEAHRAPDLGTANRTQPRLG